MTPKRSVSKKENKSPVKANRKSSLKSRKSESKSILPNEDNITEVKENINKRRLSRKSVAFNGKLFDLKIWILHSYKLL